MIYKIIEENEGVMKLFKVQSDKVWLCPLCKRAYGEGEELIIKGMNKMCRICPKTALTWMETEEFHIRYKTKLLE